MSSQVTSRRIAPIVFLAVWYCPSLSQVLPQLNGKKQNRSNYPSQSQQTQIIQWTNQNSKQIHVTSAKRGKTRASKSRLVWVLLLISRESGARFFNQSQSEVKQNQSKTRITFDTQLKTALMK